MRIVDVWPFLFCASACASGVDEAAPLGGGGKADGTSVEVLAPTYALELVAKTTIRDDREASPTTMTLRARGRVKTTVVDDVATLELRLCDVRLPQVGGYQPELSSAFIASLPPIAIKGAIDRPSMLPMDAGTPEPIMLTTEPTALVLGARLAHSLDDALPIDETDARVRDQDQDGNAGVSIAIPGYGSIFAAMRVKLAMTAPLDDVASVRGSAEITLDQSIFGDDIWFYDAKSSLAETQQHVTVESTANTVRMKRDVTTCGGVRAAFP